MGDLEKAIESFWRLIAQLHTFLFMLTGRMSPAGQLGGGDGAHDTSHARGR